MRGDLAFPGNSKVAVSPERQRIQALEKRLVSADMERDILKTYGHLE